MAKKPKKPTATQVVEAVTKPWKTRPVVGTSFDQDIADFIIEMMYEGLRLAQILRAFPELPSRGTIARWRDAHKEFGASYQKALLQIPESLYDKAIDAADDANVLNYSMKATQANIYFKGAAVIAPASFSERRAIATPTTAPTFNHESDKDELLAVMNDLAKSRDSGSS
jgi:hypothetical protein